MTATRVERPRAPYAGRRFSEFRVDDCFGDEVVVTADHLTGAAALIGDHNPLHVDPAFAARSPFGGPILHGVITAALISAPFGNLVAGTALAYLQQDARFLAPVRPGDTLRIEWRVVEVIPKPARQGGIVVAEGKAHNQRGECVAAAVGKMLVSDHLATG